jgi:rhomboid protease GluP
MRSLDRNCRKFMPTYILIIINSAIYVYTSILSENPIQTSREIILQYGQVNYLVLKGWYWQLFTAMFVHASFVHLLGNMFFLLIFGLRSEEIFAVHEYSSIYFLSGFAGNLLTLLFGPSMISAGSSGAIFGLFGACTVYIRRRFGQSIFSALLYSLFLLMISSGQNVNNLAHLGGLVTGLLIGYALATTRKTGIVYKYSYSIS